MRRDIIRTLRAMEARWFAIAGLLMGMPCATAAGQALAVQPVTLQLSPGQKAATLTITNRGMSESAVQTRAFVWNQQSGTDELVPSDEVLVSPPIVTIPPGGTQLVRLVLRRSPTEREVTYRLLLDQIPPPPVAGLVRVVLRISIPIFAQPMAAAAPRVQFHLENDAGTMWLVAVNDGFRHERFRDVTVMASDGTKLKTATSATPYILAGATRRWPIEPERDALFTGQALKLTAHGEGGTIEQQVSLEHLP